MALTSRDETDLLLPLFDGAQEDAPFATFLERVRRRAGATFVCILIRPRGAREAINLFVGPDIVRRARALQLDDLNLADRIQYDRLRPGRVYSGDEFDDHDPVAKGRRARDMRKLGLVDERAVRLLADDTADAWLVLANDRPCTAADGALLSSLAPYVGAAVRNFVAAERRKLAEALDAASLQRAGSAWIVFDRDARVLALAPAAAELLTGAGQPPASHQRLRELGPATERALIEAAARFAGDPDAPERAIVLRAEPRLEALLARAPADLTMRLEDPVMVAVCRVTQTASPARIAHLAQLHDLPRREAELAVLLAGGLSLAEAGEEMGLTIETTRNYSKRLFAKVGVRGQAELVRAVYESCAMLA